MNPRLKKKTKQKIDMYIHGDIRDGVDVRKPKSISQIIDGVHKRSKTHKKLIHGSLQSRLLLVDNASEALELSTWRAVTWE